MALRDKLNSLAATASTRANNAIENGRLALKINTEERKITEFTLNLGDLLVDKLDAGEVFDDEIMALYSSIQASRDVIAEAKAEIEANRQSSGVSVAVCSACGTALYANDKFCGHCGAKVEEPEPVEAEEEETPICPECGAELAPETIYCRQCGTKVEVEETVEAPAEEIPAEEEAAPAEE